MKVNKTLVLTGFMGSGKSTIGRVLSRQLNIPFVDLDKEIEKDEGVSIPQIFADKGESGFRKREHEKLAEVINGPPVVLALGGGALIQDQNMDLIRRNSVLLYLEVPVDALFNRLKKDRNRPLLRDEKGQLPDDPQLRRKIESLLESRTPIYLQADITVPVQSDWDIKKTMNEVIRKLSEYAPASHS